MKEKHPVRDTLVTVSAVATGLLLGFAVTIYLDRPTAPVDGIVMTTPIPQTGETDLEDPRAAEVALPDEKTFNSAESEQDDEKTVLVATEDEAEKKSAELASHGENNTEVLIVDAPEEKTGGMGTPTERLPEQETAPRHAIENCRQFFEEAVGDASPLLTREGPAKAGFSIEFDGLVNPWSLMTLTKLPGDILDLNVVEEIEGRTYRFHSDHGEIANATGRTLTWRAPEQPGIYCVQIHENESENKMCLHVAVLTPWDGESEYLNGYRLGKYQDKPFRDNPRYKKPRGFIEVNEENKERWLSPHLQLSQFVCKQQGDYPKYMLVDPRLLLKLETLIDRLEKSGRKAEHLYISSGFRTPYYNTAIGNKTSYSRHLYGDAADLFVDSNRDGKLDDLDYSGSIGDSDAKVIQRAVDSVSSEYRYLQGGLGFYSAAHYHTPFLHVDTRGYEARWNK